MTRLSQWIVREYDSKSDVEMTIARAQTEDGARKILRDLESSAAPGVTYFACHNVTGRELSV